MTCWHHAPNTHGIWRPLFPHPTGATIPAFFLCVCLPLAHLTGMPAPAPPSRPLSTGFGVNRPLLPASLLCYPRRRTSPSPHMLPCSNLLRARCLIMVARPEAAIQSFHSVNTHKRLPFRFGIHCLAFHSTASMPYALPLRLPVVAHRTPIHYLHITALLLPLTATII